ncbi:MAG: Gfo/Idh/MocA family protein, partial [Sphingobacterium sp.]
MTHYNLNKTIRVGAIGLKGMGWNNLQAILKVPDVTCVAICDIDDLVLNERSKELEEMGMKPKWYKDHKKMLSEADIDVVIVATPDHWHCLQAIDAMQAGKDVYVEKPLANSIGECDLL